MPTGPAAGPDVPDSVVAFGRERLHWREFLLSLVVTVVLGAVLYARMDVSAFTDGLKKANYALLVPVVLISSAGWVMRGVRWKLLLTPFSDCHFADVFRIFMVGTSISAVIPARAGEFWRAHAMGRQTGLSRSTVLGTIVVERVIDGVVLVLLASVALLSIGPSSSISILIGSMTAIFVAGLIFLLALTRSPKLQTFVTNFVTRLAPKRAKGIASEKTALFMHGLGALRDGRVFFSAVGLSVAVYLMDGFAYWMMGKSFGLHVNAQAYLLVVVVGNLAMALPVSIGGLGPYEFFVQQALVLQDAHSELALALALFMHVLVLVVAVTLGVLMMWARPARRGVASAPAPASP